MTDGDRGDPHSVAGCPVGHLPDDDPTGLPRLGDQRPLRGRQHLADPVGAVHRRTGRRADLAEHQPAVTSRLGREEQQVGEAEVGEHPPLRDQSLQVSDLRAPK